MVCGTGIDAGEMVGQHGGLLPQWCDQPVHLTAVFRALTHHVDVVVVD